MNAKTGPMPVSTTESSTCPSTCGLIDECYGTTGPLAIHWIQVDDGRRGVNWNTFCDIIYKLPKNQIWRHNQAGDLPGDGKHIDGPALYKLVQANDGKRGYTYTHYPLTTYNVACIESAIKDGFTISVSCDSLEEVEKKRKLTTAPLVVVLHSEEGRPSFTADSGHTVVVCPATIRDDVQCVTCELCVLPDRKYVIGFPAHGVHKKKINIRLEGI